MTDPPEQLLIRLDAGLERLMALLGEMSAEQCRFRAETGAWSPLQVAHHVLLAETLSVGTMERLAGRVSSTRSLRERLGKVCVAIILGTGIRVKNPAPPTAPDPEVGLERLESEWPAVRDRLRKVMERTEDPGTAAGFRHPIAGPLSVAESIEFLAGHLEHHLRQLDRIRRAPGFPAS